MLPINKGVDAAVWTVLVCCSWFVHQCQSAVEWWMEAVFGTWEESLKSIIRETFGQVTRIVNGFFAWVLAVFADPTSWQSPFQRSQAWQSWWRENRPSTFNAIIARDRTVKSQTTPHSSPYNTGRKSHFRGSTVRIRGYSQAEEADDHLPTLYRLSHTAFRLPAYLYGWVVSWVAGKPPPPSPASIKRRGSDLFDRPSGWAVFEQAKKRGLVEDVRLNCEVMVTASFDNARWLIRRLLLMPDPRKQSNITDDHDLQAPLDLGDSWEEMAQRPRLKHVRRSSSFSSLESMRNINTAGDVIRAAGYPLEEHTVTTADGYIQRMERIPRHGARDVVIFMHGLFDTSMGWVSNGVTGSQAFAAYDQGFDVWLGNSRANPPRAHVDPDKMGAKYWHYTVNEMGLEDVTAQIDHIHLVKCEELNVHEPGMVAGPLAKGFLPPSTIGSATLDAALGMRRSLSDTALSGGEALVPTPLPAMRNSASKAPAFPARRSSLDPEASAAARQARGGSPGETVSSSLGSRAERAVLSARLKQESRSHRLRTKTSSPAAMFHSLQHGESKAHMFDASNSVTRLQPLQSRTVGFDLSPHAEQMLRSRLGSHALDIPSDIDSVDSDADASTATPRENGHLSSPGSASASSPHAQGQSSATDSSNGNTYTHHDQTPAPPQPRRSALHMDLRNVYGANSAQYRSVGAPSSVGDHDRAQQHEPQQQSASRTAGSGSPAEASPSQRGEGAPSRRKGRDARNAHAHTHRRDVPEAYRLRAVGHSLGGASLLIYLIWCRKAKRPHHLYRLILLTPAGFLSTIPMAAKPFLWFLPTLIRLNNIFRPGKGAAVLIPSSLLRYLTFKLTMDLQQIPALQEVTRAGLRLLLNGDASQWDRAMQMPHYNTRSMPAVSLHTGAHLIQWFRSGRFQLYDYGSASKNTRAYGQSCPPDVASDYALINIPVDIVAGKLDGVIAPQNVVKHYLYMKAAGCKVTFREFNFGHLDFTFAYKDDLRHFVLSRLLSRH